MQENPAIPAGDAAFLLLEIDGAEYLAALKLNYKPGWLHYCRMDGGPAVNEVVRQGTVLPGTSGKADEAFLWTCAPTPCACWKKVRDRRPQTNVPGQPNPGLSGRAVPAGEAFGHPGGCG